MRSRATTAFTMWTPVREGFARTLSTMKAWHTQGLWYMPRRQYRNASLEKGLSVLSEIAWRGARRVSPASPAGLGSTTRPLTG